MYILVSLIRNLVVIALGISSMAEILMNRNKEIILIDHHYNFNRRGKDDLIAKIYGMKSEASGGNIGGVNGYFITYLDSLLLSKRFGGYWHSPGSPRIGKHHDVKSKLILFKALDNPGLFCLQNIGVNCLKVFCLRTPQIAS